MKNIEKVPDKIPASPEAFIELLRMYLDIAYDERMEFLRVEYKTKNMDRTSSVSIKY